MTDSADDEFSFDAYSPKFQQQTEPNSPHPGLDSPTTADSLSPSNDSSAPKQRRAQPAVTEEDPQDDPNEPNDEGDEVLPKPYNTANYKCLTLKVTPEIRDLFEHITRYTPTDITSELPITLKPFIPDYVPAIGELDAFLKVAPPKLDEKGKPIPTILEDSQLPSDDKKKKKKKSTPNPMAQLNLLGLIVLDEPSAHQSDPTVLDLQLRQTSKQASAPQTIHRIENADSNPKKLAKFIQSIEELNRSKSQPVVHYTKVQPSVDELMKVWPNEFEQALQSLSVPTADLEMSTIEYAKLVCGILDIPIYPNKLVESLHNLLTLYVEFKTNAHFAH